MARHFVRLGQVGASSWGQRPVAIVGGGPSLKGFDFERLRRRFTVLAVNASIFDVPWAEHGFSLDRRAMRNWWPRLRASVMPLTFAMPDGWLVNFDGAPAPHMSFVRRLPGDGFSTNPRAIVCGGTSGYGALQLAVMKGARHVTLFGFDYGAAAGQWHHNEAHYQFKHVQVPSDWVAWAARFSQAVSVLDRLGVQVINASPGSAITAFRKYSIDEALR